MTIEIHLMWPRWGPQCLPRKVPARKLMAIPSKRVSQLEAIVYERLVRRIVCFEAEKRLTMDEVIRLLPKAWN